MTTGTAVRGESVFGWCDLCEQHGMATAAVADLHVPGTGGMWVSVCEAHEYRLKSAERARATLDADPELAAVATLILDSLGGAR